MKTLSKRKKIILTVVIALVAIEVLRETGVLDISYYRSHIKAKTNKSWQGVAFTDVVDIPLDRNAMSLNRCGQLISIKNMSVEAAYEKNRYFITADTCEKEFVELSTFNTGATWTPLIKNTSFRATANVTLELSDLRIENKQLYRKFHDQNGQITIHGNASIIGICSSKEARSIILTHALKELAHAVRDRLLELE